MDTEKKLKLLQNTYALAIAEAANTYEKLKVLDEITKKRKERQPQTAPIINEQLGVENVADVFTKLSEVFGCAYWKVDSTPEGYEATAKECKLYALCKKMGGADACDGWCLEPIKAMIASVSKGKINYDDIAVISTLNNGECCKIIINSIE